MRRLDKLILKSFFGPFLLTTLVATFILLVQYMLKYFDDFVGKDLGFLVFAKLMFYFSLNMLQVALPLGVLVSSLMTFGNLGENSELSAIKSAGISLIRALRPIFIFVVFLSIGAFFFNNYIVPAANLKAYSLLYDIKHKKPTLDIKPGVFYHGIPDYTIKTARKLNDNKTLLDVMIYDHTKRDGNKRVILADSCKMYTIYNEKYLKLELYDGTFYSEGEKNSQDPANLTRTGFEKLDMIFSLSSFDLKRTKEELFQNNRQMKNIAELSRDIDSLNNQKSETLNNMMRGSTSYLPRHFKPMIPPPEKDTVINQMPVDIQSASILPFNMLDHLQESLKKRAQIQGSGAQIPGRRNAIMGENVYQLDTMTLADLSAFYTDLKSKRVQITQKSLGQARNFKANINGMRIRIGNMNSIIYKYTVSKYKKYAQSFACIVMFLIGAPLGAIIKKGGLGVPVIVSIFFFITYYVLTMTSEKWAKAGFVDGKYAVWTADAILFPFGLFFLRQARIDARLFDYDFYLVVLEKIKTRLPKRWIN